MRFIFIVAFLLLVSSTEAVESESSSNSPPTSRFAYATIHYEGTKRDDEYVLGILVWIESLLASKTKNDIVILLSKNVRQTTIDQFSKKGCKLKFIDNIENPYKNKKERRNSYKSHFEFTLNKIYLWSLTDYESIIYMDADNIVLHNIDSLFSCHDVCVVYMNPCKFHTGLIVLKPNLDVFYDMIDSLHDVNSYDGADQGFFTSYFKEAYKSSLYTSYNTTLYRQYIQYDKEYITRYDHFNMYMLLFMKISLSRHGIEIEIHRLPINYNLVHTYAYFEGNLNQLYLYDEKYNTIPAATITYPITPVLKPWYWWGYLVLYMNWIWNSYRLLVQPMKQFYWSYLLRVGVYLSVFFLFFILSKKKKLFQKATGRLQLYYFKYTTLFMILFSMGSLLTFIINIWLLPLFIRGTTHPSYALPLSLLHLFLGQYIYSFFIHLVTNNPTPYSTSINNEKRESTFLIYYIILFSVQFFIFRFNLQRYMNIYLLVSLYVIVGIGLIRFPIVTIWLKE